MLLQAHFLKGEHSTVCGCMSAMLMRTVCQVAQTYMRYQRIGLDATSCIMINVSQALLLFYFNPGIVRLYSKDTHNYVR
jgi:hypothetical protein